MLEIFAAKNLVVIDLEGFNLKSLWFVVKELSICTSYTDTIFFKTPVKFTELPANDRFRVLWLTRKLHGLDWDEGEIPYSDLKTICLGISFRFIRNIFFAKGIEKCELLSKLIHKTLYNLEDLFCPRISEISPPEAVNSCNLHTNLCNKKPVSNHCAERKAKTFAQWLKSDAEGGVSNFDNIPVRKFEDFYLCYSPR